MNVKAIFTSDFSFSTIVMLHSEPHKSLQQESYCWSLGVGWDVHKSLWSSENDTNAQSRQRKKVGEGEEDEGE